MMSATGAVLHPEIIRISKTVHFLMDEPIAMLGLIEWRLIAVRWHVAKPKSKYSGVKYRRLRFVFAVIETVADRLLTDCTLNAQY
jgi:hypothetical protein